MRACGVLCVVMMFACMATTAVTATRRVRMEHMRRLLAVDTVSLLIAVKQQNLEELAAACASVSTPRHEQYGQYWSRDEVTELVGSPQRVQRVVSWLRKHSALRVDVVPSQDFVRALLPAQVVEKALDVELHLFRHPTTKETVVHSSRKYTMPAALRGLVDHIVGVEPIDLANPLRPEPRVRHHPALDSVSQPQTQLQSQSHHHRVRRPVSTQLKVHLERGAPSEDRTTIEFAQTCVDGVLSQQDWPCAGTPEPVRTLVVDILEVKSSQHVTYSVTQDNAEEFQFSHDKETYSFTIPQSAVAFGHYRYNLTSIGTRGDTSMDAYPRDAWGMGSDWFIVNCVLGEPAVIRRLYNAPATAAKAAENSLAMAAFEGQTYSPDDLDAFLQQYKIASSSADVTVIGYNAGQGQDETMLDLEMEVSMAPNVPVFYIYTGSGPTSTDFMLEWEAQLSGMVDVPLVHSISYGLGEAQYEAAFGIPIEQYSARSNAELQKLCVRGVTVLVASGDAGTTEATVNDQECDLTPDYPASSPWVTAVGATAIDSWAANKSTGTTGEVVVAITSGQQWTSGGGFSQVDAQTMPDYQKAAVAAYLQVAPYTAEGANLTLRAYPDVAALGDSIPVLFGGKLYEGGGTSASSPLMAAMIAHVNAARLAAGKAAVGFFNPLLYTIYAEHPEVLYDVTIGEISCGNQFCCPRSLGFPATAGWDVPSGVGSINDLPAFIRVALNY